MTLDLAQAKRRLVVMLALDVVLAVVAIAAAVAGEVYDIAWMTWLFVGAVLAGFAVQFWFIAGFRRANKGV